jgi:hypothetical protein
MQGPFGIGTYNGSMQSFRNTVKSGLGPKYSILLAVVVVLVSLAVTTGILNMVWQYNNPKANQMTFWTHFGDVIQFKKLEQFQ